MRSRAVWRHGLRSELQDITLGGQPRGMTCASCVCHALPLSCPHRWHFSLLAVLLRWHSVRLAPARSRPSTPPARPSRCGRSTAHPATPCALFACACANASGGRAGAARTYLRRCAALVRRVPGRSMARKIRLAKHAVRAWRSIGCLTLWGEVRSRMLPGRPAKMDTCDFFVLVGVCVWFGFVYLYMFCNLPSVL